MAVNINYKSDFDFILRLKNAGGDVVPFPECDWEMLFYTASRANTYVAAYKGGIYINCRPEGDGIRFVFDGHRLSVGKLKYEFHVEMPNEIYFDGIQEIYTPRMLDIELVPGAGDCGTTAEVEALLPYIKGDTGPAGPQGPKGDKGDAFTYADFTEAEIEELQRPATEAARDLAEFQTAAEANEAERVEAEQARAEEFATWESEIVLVRDTDEELEDIDPDLLTDALRKTPQTLTNAEVKQVMNNLGRPDIKSFIDMWNQAWGAYGKYDPANAPDAEHPFMGNELWFTYAEAVEIYNLSIMNRNSASSRIQCFARLHNVRTLLPFREIGIQRSWQQAFQVCFELEVVSCNNGNFTFNPTNGVQMLYGCEKLQKVLPRIILENCSNSTEMFYHCYKLEVLDILSINCDVNLSHSPLWRFESVKYTIDNRPAHFVSKSITITVHPDVYAKLTDESNTEWHALLALAAAKNITFATI